jgi:S-adenosylmethionine synthetase
VAIGKQSADIALGVDHSSDNPDEIGAGDQGMMFGYATDETDTFMPMPIVIAHHLSEWLTIQRKNGQIPYLLPDGKTQVTIAYDDERPIAIDTIVVSTQHMEHIDMETLRADITKWLIQPTLDKFHKDYHLDISDTKVFINPTGRFVIGGPQGDAGLTGRKIIVDTYGGYARHGGGAFSGKDPSKVDRSGAYAARWVARSVVEAGLACQCEVQVSYAIGVSQPISVYINTHGSGDDDRIKEAVDYIFDLSPARIIDELRLTSQREYKRLATGGHMGRNFTTWERSLWNELRSAYGEMVDDY